MKIIIGDDGIPRLDIEITAVVEERKKDQKDRANVIRKDILQRLGVGFTTLGKPRSTDGFESNIEAIIRKSIETVYVSGMLNHLQIFRIKSLREDLDDSRVRIADSICSIKITKENKLHGSILESWQERMEETMSDDEKLGELFVQISIYKDELSESAGDKILKVVSEYIRKIEAEYINHEDKAMWYSSYQAQLENAREMFKYMGYLQYGYQDVGKAKVKGALWFTSIGIATKTLNDSLSQVEHFKESFSTAMGMSLSIPMKGPEFVGGSMGRVTIPTIEDWVPLPIVSLEDSSDLDSVIDIPEGDISDVETYPGVTAHTDTALIVSSAPIANEEKGWAKLLNADNSPSDHNGFEINRPLSDFEKAVWTYLSTSSAKYMGSESFQGRLIYYYALPRLLGNKNQREIVYREWVEFINRSDSWFQRDELKKTPWQHVLKAVGLEAIEFEEYIEKHIYHEYVEIWEDAKKINE